MKSRNTAKCPGWLSTSPESLPKGRGGLVHVELKSRVTAKCSGWLNTSPQSLPKGQGGRVQVPNRSQMVRVDVWGLFKVPKISSPTRGAGPSAQGVPQTLTNSPFFQSPQFQNNTRRKSLFQSFKNLRNFFFGKSFGFSRAWLSFYTGGAQFFFALRARKIASTLASHRLALALWAFSILLNT